MVMMVFNDLIKEIFQRIYAFLVYIYISARYTYLLT